jgi:hypothetical protein
MFKPAQRKQAKLRLALIGCSGSGKSYSALLLAKGLGGKVAVLDTERGSASLYSDICKFDTCELNAPFSPERYVKVIKEAEQAGYTTLIIDSLSHAWAGEGGLLEMVDNCTASSRSKNAFTEGWKKCTPEQNKLMNAILTCNLHIICCLRTKVAYEIQSDGQNRMKPVKLGMAPIQREGVDYEFTLIFDIDNESHLSVASKNRTSLFKGTPFLITENTGKEISNWLNEGVYIDTSKDDTTKQNYLDQISQCETIEEVVDLCKKAKEAFSNDLNFQEILKKSYKERKEAIEFFDGTSDQRGLGAEPESYGDKR